MKTTFKYFLVCSSIAVFPLHQHLYALSKNDSHSFHTISFDNTDDINNNMTLSVVDAASETYLPSNKVLAFDEANRTRNNLIKQLETNPKSIPVNWALMRYYLTAPSFVGGSHYQALNFANYIYSLNKYIGCIAYENVYTAMHNWDRAKEWYRNSLNMNLPKGMYWEEISFRQQSVANLKVTGNFNNWKIQNMYEEGAGSFKRKVMVPICEGCQYKLIVNNMNIQSPTKTEMYGNSWDKK